MAASLANDNSGSRSTNNKLEVEPSQLAAHAFNVRLEQPRAYTLK